MPAIYRDILWIIIITDLSSPSIRWVQTYFVAEKHVRISIFLLRKIIQKSPSIIICFAFSTPFHNSSSFECANIWTSSKNSTWYWCRCSRWLLNQYDFLEVRNDYLLCLYCLLRSAATNTSNRISGKKEIGCSTMSKWDLVRKDKINHNWIYWRLVVAKTSCTPISKKGNP